MFLCFFCVEVCILCFIRDFCYLIWNIVPKVISVIKVLCLQHDYLIRFECGVIFPLCIYEFQMQLFIKLQDI